MCHNRALMLVGNVLCVCFFGYFTTILTVKLFIQKKRRQSNSTGHVLHTNCFLQHVIEKENCNGREDEKEDVSIYWIVLRKREDTGIEKRIIISHALQNALWKNVDLSTCYLLLLLMYHFVRFYSPEREHVDCA